MVKNGGDLDLTLGSGRSSGEGNGNPFQYSCLENSMDRGAWRAIVHRVAKSDTILSFFFFFISRIPTLFNQLDVNSHIF